MTIKYCVAKWGEDDTVYWVDSAKGKNYFSPHLHEAKLIDKSTPILGRPDLSVLPVFIPDYPEDDE